MSEPAYYRHSGEFAPHLILVGAALAMLVSLPLAWLYAKGIYHIPWVYLNLLLTAGFGWVLGFVLVWVLRGSRVRNTTMALMTAVAVVGFAFYFHWAAWVSTVFAGADVDVGVIDAALQPGALWAAVLAINEGGAWGFGENPVTGGFLWAIWGAEALIVFGIALYWTHAEFQDVPYCETCDSWCEKEKNVARLTGDDPDAIVAAVTRKDFEALATFPRVPLDADMGGWIELALECCPKCRRTNTLDACAVVFQENSKGQNERKETEIVQNLLISRDEVEKVRALAGPMPAAGEMPAAGAGAMSAGHGMPAAGGVPEPGGMPAAEGMPEPDTMPDFEIDSGDGTRA